jgi:hypothetical protein
MAIKDLEKRREYQKKYNKNRFENKEKRHEYGKKSYAKNRARIMKYRKKYRKEHRDELRKRRIERGDTQREKKNKLMKAYSISMSQYSEILNAQNGVCAICGKGPSGRSLSVDHDHQTGKIRGLLCTTCNAGIGLLCDDYKLLVKAADYLISK